MIKSISQHIEKYNMGHYDDDELIEALIKDGHFDDALEASLFLEQDYPYLGIRSFDYAEK